MEAHEKPSRVAGPDSPAIADEKELAAARNANRFDIRRLIGGLFLVYGVILTLMGLFGSAHIKHKAAGININLWTGIGMLIFGALMVFWALKRPVTVTRGGGSEQTQRAPASEGS